MKRFLTIALVAAATAVWLGDTAQAFGRRNRSRCDQPASPASCYAPAMAAAGCCPADYGQPWLPSDACGGVAGSGGVGAPDWAATGQEPPPPQKPDLRPLPKPLPALKPLPAEGSPKE